MSLVALAALLIGLLVVQPDLDRSPADSLSLAAAPRPPSVYTGFTSDADFTEGARRGTAVSNGALQFAKARGARNWARRSYEFAAWTSPWVTPRVGFTQLVPTWNATTPPGSWIQVFVQVRDDLGNTSKPKVLGRWSLRDGGLKRSSAGTQSDAVARVSTDTVVASRRTLKSYRITVRLLRTPGRKAPAVGALGAVTSTPTSALPATSKPLKKSAAPLSVPAYSQMTHLGQAPQYGGGGEAWCSPTALSMVLSYYGRLPGPAAYRWVPQKYSDRWVNHVARMTYDYAYEGTGNWPFNTAYAATRTGNAFVTRLVNLRMAERFIRAGIPLIVSIKFSRGQLSNAPISATAGHLVVLTGFTPEGDPIVNDPAANSNGSVKRVYDRAQFEHAWLRGSYGMTYVVHDADHPLPYRPRGVQNW